MKKIIVFGGAGFIGSNLARKLVNSGHEVAVFDDFSTGKLSNLEGIKDKINIIRGDVRNLNEIDSAIDKVKPDAIYYLAALHFIPDCNKDPQKAWDINVEGVKNIFKSLNRLNLKPRFIHVSTSSVYRPSNEKIKETDPAEPFEVYGKTKLAGERVLEEESAKNGIIYFIVRPFSVYGPFVGIPQVIPEIVSQLKTGKNEVVLGNLNPVRDFIHVTDAADALALLLDSGEPSAVYNLGANASNSIEEVTEIIAKLLSGTGREIKFISDQSRFRGELERDRLVGDDNKIMNDLNWQPEIDLETGLQMTLRAEKLIQ